MDYQKLEQSNLLQAKIKLRREYLNTLLMYKKPPPGLFVRMPSIMLSHQWENGEATNSMVVSIYRDGTPDCLHPIIEMWGRTLLPSLISVLEENIEQLEKEFKAL